jgi:hypothetical protein
VVNLKLYGNDADKDEDEEPDEENNKEEEENEDGEDEDEDNEEEGEEEDKEVEISDKEAESSEEDKFDKAFAGFKGKAEKVPTRERGGSSSEGQKRKGRDETAEGMSCAILVLACLSAVSVAIITICR